MRIFMISLFCLSVLLCQSGCSSSAKAFREGMKELAKASDQLDPLGSKILIREVLAKEFTIKELEARVNELSLKSRPHPMQIDFAKGDQLYLSLSGDAEGTVVMVYLDNPFEKDDSPLKSIAVGSIDPRRNITEEIYLNTDWANNYGFRNLRVWCRKGDSGVHLSLTCRVLLKRNEDVKTVRVVTFEGDNGSGVVSKSLGTLWAIQSNLKTTALNTIPPRK